MGMDNPHLRDTIFASLMAILDTHDFIDAPKDPELHEEVIGNMNDYERALYTLSILHARIAMEISDRLNGDGPPYSHEDLPELRKELAINRLRASSAQELLFNNIRERLYDYSNPATTIWRIRSDFRIVLVFEPDPYGMKCVLPVH